MSVKTARSAGCGAFRERLCPHPPVRPGCKVVRKAGVLPVARAGEDTCAPGERSFSARCNLSRRLWTFGSVLQLLASPAAAQAPSIGRVVLRAETPPGGPYVEEMFLLRIRSNIRANVTLDQFRQPPLLDFDWQQYGVDAAVEDMIDGFRVPGVERTLALFPRHAGRLAIEPFTRHVTIQTDSGARVEVDFVSQPLEIDVRAHDGVGPAGAWWLPARSVKLTDTWAPRPDRIGLNETARRIVTLEVEGIAAERLPPMPPLRVQGLITFAGPVERETLVTADGPRARATYRWDVRPVSDDPATTPAIHIPWFDSGARVMRDAALPEMRVKFTSPTGADEEAAVARPPVRAFSLWPLLAAAAAFVWTLAAMVLLSGRGGSRSRKRDPLLPLDG